MDTQTYGQNTDATGHPLATTDGLPPVG